MTGNLNKNSSIKSFVLFLKILISLKGENFSTQLFNN